MKISTIPFLALIISVLGDEVKKNDTECKIKESTPENRLSKFLLCAESYDKELKPIYNQDDRVPVEIAITIKTFELVR